MIRKASFVVVILLFVSAAIGFGKHCAQKFSKEEEICDNVVSQSRLSESSESTDSPYYNHGSTSFGIVQKIPYINPISEHEPIELHFSSACVKCGMCLAIANEINDTLLEIYQSAVSRLNDTEVIFLLRTICDFAFKHYSLREIDGKRFICDQIPTATLVTSSADGFWEKNLRGVCHGYLDEIGPLNLHQQWQYWFYDERRNPDLFTILCRNEAGVLRDCVGMKNIAKYDLFPKTHRASLKIKAEFNF